MRPCENSVQVLTREGRETVKQRCQGRYKFLRGVGGSQLLFCLWDPKPFYSVLSPIVGGRIECRPIISFTAVTTLGYSSSTRGRPVMLCVAPLLVEVPCRSSRLPESTASIMLSGTILVTWGNHWGTVGFLRTLHFKAKV